MDAVLKLAKSCFRKEIGEIGATVGNMVVLLVNWGQYGCILAQMICQLAYAGLVGHVKVPILVPKPWAADAAVV
jgi:hypothetical protein